GRGAQLGPDLSNVAQSLSRSQIVQAILRPSDQFPPQYQAWVVITMDGLVYNGLQLDHKAAGAMNLMLVDGQTKHFAGDDVDEYFVSDRSIMPDGLDSSLSVEELRDLVAFLSSLR
ncbi:MAG: hypothetical protein KDA61_13010, partial [Planctomycetales bacterium]|nr:hypothetical protein [Planctomycetales bacterium]